MAWVYNGNKSAFASITDFGTLYVAGASQFVGSARFDGTEFHNGNETHNAQEIHNGKTYYYDDMNLTNEKWLKTALPVVPPGPSGNRLTPNIQFQPRTLNGAVSATGLFAMHALVLPTGIVQIGGSIILPQAARTGGTVIWDLGNTNLERRLWPAYNIVFPVVGLGDGSGTNPHMVLLGGSGQCTANAFNTTTAGNQTYHFNMHYSPGSFNSGNGVEFSGYFYGNGGY